ncbi:MAG TPA: molybdopterin cofactor-binding domain-containing protein, partial [Gemmataceae bacterium]|nr:molybdopterin cofactor-binding domain-containing protein [Gemmataceae bacterium]
MTENTLEPERYELWTGDETFWEPDRRAFFRILGGGIVVGLVLGDLLRNGFAFAQGRGNGRLPREISAWLHIAQDSAVTAYTGKVEIGQNIRTSLTQVVAEELHVPLGRIRLVMADTDLTPFDAGTFGSQTTPQMA